MDHKFGWASVLALLFSAFLSSCGGGSSGGITASPELTLFAGNLDGIGHTDGSGTAARFSNPTSLASDSAGNIYVADSENNTIRKISPIGVVSTLAGTAGNIGSADASGAAASFYYPQGVVTDSTGNIYVAAAFNHTIRKITPVGAVSTIAGTAGSIGSADAIGAAARFNYPESVATDSTGNIYVADSGNSTVRKITPGGVVSTVVGVAGKVGFIAGALPAKLMFPAGVAVNAGSLDITMGNGVAVVRNLP